MLTSEEIHPDHQGPGKDPFKHSLSRIGRLTGAARLEDSGVILYGDNANLAIVPVASGILRLKVFFGENAPDLGTTPAILPIARPGDVVLSEDEEAYTIASPDLRASLSSHLSASRSMTTAACC